MSINNTATLNEAIQTVLGLADNELCSLYAVARRDGDKELEAQADAAAKALAQAEPLLKAAPKMLDMCKRTVLPARSAGKTIPR
jgi:hypothetical protein